MGKKDNYWIIYTLRLEDDCWYVGSTTTRAFKDRMADHWKQAGKGSNWTALHKPIMVQDIDVHDRNLSASEIARLEDKRTLILAKSLGCQYVRGGGYCQSFPRWPSEVVDGKLNRGANTNMLLLQ